MYKGLEMRIGLVPEYPPMNAGENVTYYPGRYRGTPENLASLVSLSEDPNFRRKYANSVVYADGAEVLGATPFDPAVQKQRRHIVAKERFNAELDVRGIELDDCAKIRIVGGVEAPAPAPVLDGILFSAPTR